MVAFATQDVIESRRSTRTFLKTPLSGDDVDKIAAYLEDHHHLVGPFGHLIELDLVIESEERAKDTIGTYGVIRNPQGYILGRSIIDTTSLFDYGFVLENVVLYLTALDIGTCWLGGRFDKEQAKGEIALADGEIIPAITPIGYSEERQRTKERVMRTFLHANKRKPDDQLFFYEAFGQPLGSRGVEYQQALHYLKIGPSAQNKQPWRLIFNADLSQVHFYITSALADHPLYMCPPEYLDIGIAYNHFKVGLDQAGIDGQLVIHDPGIEKPEGSSYIASWHRD